MIRRLVIGNRRRRLREDDSGAAVVEFALVAPLFIFVMMGLFDFSQWMYARSVLNGAAQDAARLSALETGDTAVADAHVARMISRITPDAVVSTTRRSYFDFADIGRPEQWNDEDNNGTCNDSENYTDENSNGQWDDDIGESGNGNASDVVIYTVTVQYEPSFAMPLVPYIGDTREISSTVVKKNQPFALQTGLSSEAGTCD